jgi:hypothetical protein
MYGGEEKGKEREEREEIQAEQRVIIDVEAITRERR